MRAVFFPKSRLIRIYQGSSVLPEIYFLKYYNQVFDNIFKYILYFDMTFWSLVSFKLQDNLKYRESWKSRPCMRVTDSSINIGRIYFSSQKYLVRACLTGHTLLILDAKDVSYIISFPKIEHTKTYVTLYTETALQDIIESKRLPHTGSLLLIFCFILFSVGHVKQCF